jgi:hypothetical protein
MVCFSIADDENLSMQFVKQKLHHCGPACAETILRIYGDRDSWMDQTTIASALCGRLPEYKLRHPEAKTALERYYPDFVETYQPELAELLMDYGYCVINIKNSVNPATGHPSESVWDILKSHLIQGHKAIVHIPKHYLALIDIDIDKQRLYFVDTLIPEEVFSCSFSAFSSGLSFHQRLDGSQHGGWDGRTLIFWKGETINQKDQCPICRERSTGMSYTYCSECGCFINRRYSNKVQKAIDAISNCTEGKGITKVNPDLLKTRFGNMITKEGFNEADLRQALLHYPLFSENRDKIETLHRANQQRIIELENLSLDDLIEIVSSGEKWENELEIRLPN